MRTRFGQTPPAPTRTSRTRLAPRLFATFALLAAPALALAAGVSVNELKYASTTVRPPANTTPAGYAHKQFVAVMLNQF